MLPPQEGASQRSPVLWLSSIYVYTVCRRITKFDVVTHVGEGVYLGVSHEYQQSGIPALPNFCSSPVFVPIHPLTQYDQIWHSNTYEEEVMCFRRSVTPLHFHNASRGLSATAEFLVVACICQQVDSRRNVRHDV